MARVGMRARVCEGADERSKEAKAAVTWRIKAGASKRQVGRCAVLIEVSLRCSWSEMWDRIATQYITQSCMITLHGHVRRHTQISLLKRNSVAKSVYPGRAK